MKQNTILLASLIVLAVALIGAGAWVYQNQIAPKPAPVIQTAPSEQSEAEKQAQINDETADWQKYQSEILGIELKYPKNWFMGDGNPSREKYRSAQISIQNGDSGMDGEVGEPREGYAAIIMQINKPRVDSFGQAHGDISFQEFVKMVIKNPERGTGPAVMPELFPVIIGGCAGFRVQNYESYYIDQGDGRYATISIFARDNENERIINQILATLKFSKPQTEEKVIEKFEVAPAEEILRNGIKTIEYASGAKAVVLANSVAKVELRQRGGGTGVYSDPEGGLVGELKKVGANRWEIALPNRDYNTLCVLAYDAQGTKIDETCLYNVISRNESQSQNETASWQTYRNEKYGYEMQYPNNWRKDINPLYWNTERHGMIFCPPESFPENNDALLSGVGDDVNKGCGSKRRVWSADNGNIMVEGIGEIPSEDYAKNWQGKLKDPPLVYLFKTDCEERAYDYVLLGKDGQEFCWIARNSGAPKEIFDKMVSTFKFIEPESSYDIFGGSEFSTIVRGYYQKKEDIVYGIGDGENEGIAHSRAYFVITEFEDSGFKDSVKQGIERGNSYNRFEDNHYKFNLGFFNDQKIECDNYKNMDLPCLDEVVELKIKNSTSQNTVRIKLFFGKRDNTASNLAYKIELAD